MLVDLPMLCMWLLCAWQVLAALSVRGGCGVTGHVPYRDSRLTQLLWDGLRGELLVDTSFVLSVSEFCAPCCQQHGHSLR
jgi:hypothetical protein